MDKKNDPTQRLSMSKGTSGKPPNCPDCHRSIQKGGCKCPGPPRGRRKKVATTEGPVEGGLDSKQLLNGRSLLKHTKSKHCNVPDSTGRLKTSSETKSEESRLDETKLLLNDISIGSECLNNDKEAVNLTSSSFGSEPKNIFENDFECLDSTMLVKGQSSQTLEERIATLERTPVKVPASSTTPNAPQKSGARVETPRTPDDHEEYVVRPPRHSCPFCSKTFRSNGKLNSHVFSHTGERPFACKHCHKAFSSKFKLVRHLLIHSEDRKYLCTVCERRFLRNDHLKNHYKVHDPRKVVFRCERQGCEKEYSSALSQRKHEAWHRAQDGERTCLLCGIKHETSAELLIHLRRHSGSRLLKSPADRKFRCHVCERYFLTRKDVTRHLVVHTGDRDFLCQFCPQRFGRKDHLVRHIKKSHLAPAKRKINKSILTLNNKSKTTKTKKLTTSNAKSKTIVITVKEKEDESANRDDPEHPQRCTEIAKIVVPSVPTNIVILPPSSILVVQAPSEASGATQETTDSPLDIFPFPDPDPTAFEIAPPPDDSLLTEANRRLLETQSRKGGDLFEGTSQSLMFSEPSFDDEEYKCTDFMENQGESSGELLRYLLQSDTEAPLPGFNQIFSCPTTSS